MLQSRQSQQLYNSGNYEELCGFWDNGESRNSLVEWDYYYLIRSFYNLKRYNLCLDVYAEFHERFPKSHLGDFYAGWAIYYFIKEFDHKTQRPSLLITKLTQLQDMEKNEKSAHKRSILTACDKLASSSSAIPGQPNNWQLIYDYLTSIPENELSTASYKKESDGKTIFCPSELESWFNDRAKALKNLGKWQDCIDCINDALSHVHSFHCNIDLWMQYYKAECLINLNQANEAEKILFSLEVPLHGWVIEAAIFKVEKELDQINEAKIHASKCALSDNKHSYRVNFYSEFAYYLEKLGLAEEAQMHWRWSRLLRQKEGWPINAEESKRIIVPEISALSEETLLHKLTEFWKSNLYPEPKMTGQIVYVRNEYSGLIKTDQEPIRKYEFRLDKRTHEKLKPKLGQKYNFILAKSYNKRTDSLSLSPVIISLIEE